MTIIQFRESHTQLIDYDKDASKYTEDLILSTALVVHTLRIVTKCVAHMPSHAELR